MIGVNMCITLAGGCDGEIEGNLWHHHVVKLVDHISLCGVDARMGVLHQMFGNWVQYAITIWTQSDLRFCKNEGSKRSRFNEKVG